MDLSTSTIGWMAEKAGEACVRHAQRNYSMVVPAKK